jgi:hypothetical protein
VRAVKTSSIRFDQELVPRIEAYVRQNKIKLNRLVNLAVQKFISETNSIALVPIESKDWEKGVEKAFKKHKKAMDELK